MEATERGNIPIFLKQGLVFLAPQVIGLCIGGAVSFPAVLISQLQGNHTQIHLDLATTSWIGSIQGCAGIPSILMPALMLWKGRKPAFMTACIAATVGWVAAGIATSAVGLLISQSFLGLGAISLVTVSLLSINEMVDPIRRSASMKSFTLFLTLGITISGMLKDTVHWRTVSIIMGIYVALAFCSIYLWHESSWLEINRLEKVVGGTISNELEVARKERCKESYLRKPRFTIGQFKNRAFYIPIMHMFLLLFMIYGSGGSVIIVYSIDIVKMAIYNQIIPVYGLLLINCIILIGVIISMVLVNRVSNKLTLSCSIIGCIICLGCASLVSYMQNIEVLTKDSFLCLYCIIGFMLAISLGIPVTFNMAADLMAVQYREEGCIMYIIIMCLLHTFALKLYPYLIFYLHLWGTLLIYMINAMVCGVLVWKFIPERTTMMQLTDDYCMLEEFEPRRLYRDPIDELDTPMIDYS